MLAAQRFMTLDWRHGWSSVHIFSFILAHCNCAEGGCAKLKRLDLSGCSMLSAELLVSIVSRASELVTLVLESDYRLNNAAIQAFARSSSLPVFSPHDCRNSRQLEQVNFRNCKEIGAQALEALTELPKLTSINFAKLPLLAAPACESAIVALV